MASRRLSGRLRGGRVEPPGRPRRRPEAPRALQDGPKRRRESLNTWRTRAPRRSPGAHFGPRGGSFWRLRGSILDSSGRPYFEAPGQQNTKRQKERTCKTCNALKLKTFANNALHLFLHQATCLSLLRLLTRSPSLLLRSCWPRLNQPFRSRAGAGNGNRDLSRVNC